MVTTLSIHPAKKARKPRAKSVVTHRQFFLDDEGRNKLRTKSTAKTMVLSLQLESENSRVRKIGVITKSTKTLVVERRRADHLFVKGNAYGFNEYILKNAKLFNTIRLSDEYHDWKIPVEFILKEGKHLNFKQQGFELQLFVSLEQLAPFRVYKKEGRRI
jgi:hypothetical protein